MIVKPHDHRPLLTHLRAARGARFPFQGDPIRRRPTLKGTG